MRFLAGSLAALLLGCGSSASDPGADIPGSGGSAEETGQAAGGSIGSGGAAGASVGSGAGGAPGAGGSSSGGGAGKASSDASTGPVPSPDAGSGGAGGGIPRRDASVSACGKVVTAQPTATDLVPGKWTNITPPTIHMDGGGGALALAIAPGLPGVIYVGIEAKIGGDPSNGLWKSTNSGKSWVLLGERPDSNPYDNVSRFLDLPISMLVDPNDSQHLYVTEGVRGGNNGFWVSTDGGVSWTRMQAPKETTDDVALVAAAPCDFNHILVSPHGYWSDGKGGAGNAGILESKDGGKTWITHMPPGNPWAVGTKGVLFLHHPETGQGDDNTWLVTDNGFWRTSDAGATWTKVSEGLSPHGTNEFYYAANGDLYAGESAHLERSTDNGLTWKPITGVPNQSFLAVTGDGTTLFTMPDAYPPGSGYWTSPETDGTKWTLYSDTTKPPRGPIRMRFDPINRIIYSANWDAGVWALKLP